MRFEKDNSILYRLILLSPNPKKKSAKQENEAKQKYRDRLAHQQQFGKGGPRKGRGGHARDAEKAFGLAEADFAALRQPFRKRLNKERQERTLDGRPRAKRLPTLHQHSSQPKLPRGSTFPEAGKLLVFCLHYWHGGLSQPALARRYGMSQPQVNRWLKYAHPLLLATLQTLAAAPEDAARALAARLLPGVTTPRLPRGRTAPPTPAAAG